MVTRRVAESKSSRPKLPDGQEPRWESLGTKRVNLEALLTPVLAHAFDELEVSVSIWTGADRWYPIRVGPNVAQLEAHHGVIRKRWAYNRHCYAKVLRSKRRVLGKHAGLCDLFVPILEGNAVWGLLVAGPFATSRPTSADVMQRWFELTRSQGRLTDPSFSRFLSATLSTLTLEGAFFSCFERLVQCFADLMAGVGAAAELGTEAEDLRRELLHVRFAERMWDAARTAVDEVMAAQVDLSLAQLGLGRMPAHAIVGLLRDREGGLDPIDNLIRRNAYQRACTTLARKTGNMVAGQLGDHGVTLLVDYHGSAAKTRARLTEITGRAAATARRFGFDLHAGIGVSSESTPLVACYRSALWAAEKALSSGLRVVDGEPHTETSDVLLRKLRGQLGESIREPSAVFAPRFEQYIEAVLAHCGYRLELTRAQLEFGIERLADPLLAGGLLDPKSFDALFVAAERSAQDAATVSEVVAAYRRMVADIEAVLKSPTVARHDRGTRVALEFIREHLGEPLSLGQVARVAGFAPDYFGRLFKHDQGVTLVAHVRKLRIERAQRMLRETELSVEQVRRLCGFRVRTYFHHAFRRIVGMTPVEYRTHSVRDIA